MTRRSLYWCRALVAAGAVAALSTTGTAVAAAPATEPQLRLVSAASAVTLDRWEDEPVWLDLGTRIVTGSGTLEVRVKRDSYRDPIVANQIVRSGNRQRSVPLPAGMVTGFSGFADFTHVTLKDASGATVVDQDVDFCPNSYYASRARPDAVDKTPYPWSCPTNPFTLGSVWGVPAGWSTPTIDPWGGASADLTEGVYTASISVNQRYRDFFGIPADQSSATVQVTVRQVDGSGGRALRKAGAAGKPQSVTPRAAASRPTGAASVPRGPKPDLRSLPAWQILVTDDEGSGGTPTGRQYLAFSATVWTGGNSPLVVDGFRRDGTDLMDAYQYFYDANGNQVGYAPAGTMEWDDRDGHNHWHFTDFAQYRLLDASQQLAVKSAKEAFCLANTDGVDYTLPRANWRPENTDLHTSCGDNTALSVREVLDIGNGDTYTQYLPGQSFDITDLPNGTYYIEVAANPEHRLYESDLTNNVSLRQVILGGTPGGARTVQVPPHDGIDA